jgi:hypothetical protein
MNEREKALREAAAIAGGAVYKGTYPDAITSSRDRMARWIEHRILELAGEAAVMPCVMYWASSSSLSVNADEAVVRRLGAPDQWFDKLWWGQQKASTLMGVLGSHAVVGWKCRACRTLIFASEVRQLEHACFAAEKAKAGAL